MADTTLTLTAKLVGEFEQNIKQYQRLVKQFEADQARSAPEAAKRFFESTKKSQGGLKDLKEGAISLQREMKAVGETVGKLTPGFSGLTSEIGLLARGAGSAIGVVTALAAATAFTAKKLGDFSNSMLSVRNSARRAQMTLPDMRDFIQLGARWGKSSEEMQGAAVNFAEAFTKISKNIGGFRNILERTEFPVSGKRLADFIQLHPNDIRGALEETFKIMEEIEKKEGPVAAKKFAEALGLPADFALHTAKDFVDGLKSVKGLREEMGITDDKLMKLDQDAESFRKEWVKTEEIYKLWGQEFDRLILPDFIKLVKAFNELFGNRKAVEWADGFLGALKAPLQALQLMKSIIEYLSGSKIMQFFMSMTPGGGGLENVPGVGPVPGGGGGGGGGGGAGAGDAAVPSAGEPSSTGATAGAGGGERGSTAGLGHGLGGPPQGEPAGEYAGKTAQQAGITPEFPVDKGVNWQNMDANLVATMNQMYRDAPSSAKSGFRLHSGYRSYDEQARIYASGVRPAAKPGGSQHQFGHAGDVIDPSGWFHQHAGEYGAGFLSGDYPHMRLAGHHRLPISGMLPEYGGPGTVGGGAHTGAVGSMWADPYLANAARAAMDSSAQQKVEGKGTIDISVNQQKARGRANPRNILKPLSLPRAVQRQPADSGPQETRVDKPSSYEFNM
jgi:hypothetical protein